MIDWQAEKEGPKEDIINSPKHYQTKYGLEAADVIEMFELDKDHYIATAVYYLLRAGRKNTREEDMKKAIWWLNRGVERAERGVTKKVVDNKN